MPGPGLQPHLAVGLAQDPADERAGSLRGCVLFQRPDAAPASVDAGRRHFIRIVLIAQVVVKYGA